MTFLDLRSLSTCKVIFWRFCNFKVTLDFQAPSRRGLKYENEVIHEVFYKLFNSVQYKVFHEFVHEVVHEAFHVYVDP